MPTSIYRRLSEVKRLWSVKLCIHLHGLAKTPPTRTERFERVLQFASARRIAGEAYNGQPKFARMSTYRSSSPSNTLKPRWSVAQSQKFHIKGRAKLDKM